MTMNCLLIISLIYIVIHHIIIMFSNIFVLEYIYPYISNLIDYYIKYALDTYNDYIINQSTNDDIYHQTYSHHYINKKKLNKNKLNKNIQLLSLLTCPICYNIYDKIYICPNGHSLCSKCFNNSDTCSYCRCEINKNTRNRALEEMLENMELPCSYYKYGCPKFILNKDRCKHESHCPFLPIKCHIDNCLFESNYTDMKEHILNKHSINNLMTSDSNIHHNYNLIFDIQQNINFNALNDLCNIFTVLDTNDNLIFIKWFIQTGLLKNLQHDEPNELCKNKALCFVLLGIHNNNFNINIYNKNEKKFGKYTMLNKLKNNINYCNTIAIPLSSVYDIKHTHFNIDINIYEKNSKKIKFKPLLT